MLRLPEIDAVVLLKILGRAAHILFKRPLKMGIIIVIKRCRDIDGSKS